MRNKIRALKSDSEFSSEDSLKFIEDFEEPAIEINEFNSIIDKKYKLPDNTSSYSRKRSYSKEDLKIGINAMLSGNISPEWIISDVEDYEENDEFETLNVKNTKKTSFNLK